MNGWCADRCQHLPGVCPSTPMPMPIDVSALVARKARLPLVPGTARSSMVVMDGPFSFEVKGRDGGTVVMGNAKSYAFLPLGDPIRDRVVGSCCVGRRRLATRRETQFSHQFRLGVGVERMDRQRLMARSCRNDLSLRDWLRTLAAFIAHNF